MATLSLFDTVNRYWERQGNVGWRPERSLVVVGAIDTLNPQDSASEDTRLFYAKQAARLPTYQHSCRPRPRMWVPPSKSQEASSDNNAEEWEVEGADEEVAQTCESESQVPAPFKSLPVPQAEHTQEGTQQAAAGPLGQDQDRHMAWDLLEKQPASATVTVLAGAAASITGKRKRPNEEHPVAAMEGTAEATVEATAEATAAEQLRPQTRRRKQQQQQRAAMQGGSSAVTDSSQLQLQLQTRTRGHQRVAAAAAAGLDLSPVAAALPAGASGAGQGLSAVMAALQQPAVPAKIPPTDRASNKMEVDAAPQQRNLRPRRRAASAASRTRS